MKNPTLIILIFITVFSQAQKVIPYNTTPDWISNPNGHISTGLGLADINGDGWKDLVVAIGNDIERQPVVVYYNQGDGAFNQDPDWYSNDIDYHGHLSCGDINHDGWVDVAVSVYLGPSGFSSPGKVKVYYNQGGELEKDPSFTSENFYTFSCALGDANADGWLDLAAAAAEPYSGTLDEGKIFMNNNGLFTPAPQWQSAVAMGPLDVDFADFDLNGYLDVVFTCEDAPTYIYLAGSTGAIDPTPAWYSAESTNFNNSLDAGLTRGKETMSLVVTGNNQLGGDGKVRHYAFDQGVPGSSQASWLSNPFGYGSGIILANIDNDEYLDLIYGGWWLPVKIAMGDENGFELNTSYTSATNSVVEAIQMADLDRDHIQHGRDTLVVGTATAGIVILKKQLVENILQVVVNGDTLETSAYCSVSNKNWISFHNHLQQNDTVVVDYEWSDDLEIVVTNWDSQVGEYIFYNTTSHSGHVDHPAGDNSLSVFPNPTDGALRILFAAAPVSGCTFEVISLSGTRLLSGSLSWPGNVHSPITIDLGDLSAGMYILRVTTGDSCLSEKILVR
jgi:hypothetical protein